MNDAAKRIESVREKIAEVLGKSDTWRSEKARALAVQIRHWSEELEWVGPALTAQRDLASHREHELEQALLKAESDREEAKQQRDDAVALLEELLPHLEYDAPASGYVTARPVPDALRWDALCMVDGKYEAWKPLEQERHD